MKKNLLIISDYIEGSPVIASVRYSSIMEKLKEKFNLVVVNNYAYGKSKSKYSQKNFKFKTLDQALDQVTLSFDDSKKEKKNIIKYLLRLPPIIKLWRSIKFSKTVFKLKNKVLISELLNYIKNNEIYCVFLTVPEIYGIYLVEIIKKNYPSIKILTEIRDILNNSIGEGNPSFIFSRSEKIILRNTDHIIALSNGIIDYYHQLMEKINKYTRISLIRNGYDYEIFKDCRYNESLYLNNTLVFSHIGSIYKGRNVLDFLKALELLSNEINKKIIFNVVGVLDKGARLELHGFEPKNIELNILGPLPHKNAVNVLKNSDISVIFTHKKGSEYAIPGKTFEYIGACKPIIAVTEDKELKNLIQPKYGECAAHNSDDIIKKIKLIINKRYDFSNRESYSRNRQIKKIISLINELNS